MGNKASREKIPREVYPNFQNIFLEISVPFDIHPGIFG